MLLLPYAFIDGRGGRDWPGCVRVYCLDCVGPSGHCVLSCRLFRGPQPSPAVQEVSLKHLTRGLDVLSTCVLEHTFLEYSLVLAHINNKR